MSVDLIGSSVVLTRDGAGAVTLSKAGNTDDLISLARPVKFSLKIGFFLCGIAEEAFCFIPKNSATSKTAVL